MPFRQFPDYLLISEAVAATFTVARLLHFRLWRRFPFLISYLIVLALRAASLSVLVGTSRAYFRVYLVASPTLCCVAALAVWEMFALIFRDYPGLRTAGRWTLYIAIAGSVVVWLLITKAPWPGESVYTRLLFHELDFERSITFWLALVIVLQMIFLSRYPLDLDRNTYCASGFFSAMFLTQAVVRLVDSLSPRLYAFYADYPEVAFTALCLVGWGIMLQPANAAARVHAPANKRRETELLQQLESLNSILSRSAHR